jgi:pantoate--beta-alanine ligase
VMEMVLAKEPLAKAQYVSCSHPTTLQELDGNQNGALLSMAVLIGKTRLIDNLLLDGG